VSEINGHKISWPAVWQAGALVVALAIGWAKFDATAQEVQAMRPRVEQVERVAASTARDVTALEQRVERQDRDREKLDTDLNKRLDRMEGKLDQLLAPRR